MTREFTAEVVPEPTAQSSPANEELWECVLPAVSSIPKAMHESVKITKDNHSNHM